MMKVRPEELPPPAAPGAMDAHGLANETRVLLLPPLRFESSHPTDHGFHFGLEEGRTRRMDLMVPSTKPPS